MAQLGYNAPGKELLAFGQAIQVGEHNVRVERHLSQGGFAHVYLVRTDKPVGGTTQHVLKHIRVNQESMLNEVRKEVDIMRLLRGHTNIVHLIDAAWSKQPNGIFEVFILMEFCPGGGIIDMMNRRLRERLTEAEILQIFVDVCEGLACMHNLRPALLHRDLKVENILQSTGTKYKLCDFGSATPVATRPPSTVAEIQALGHDLDRHTTLQYRAPEMIDPNLRRPIDEKSDVWALGVLLYKLCYYTTPFEEHGPLAILNVQYTFPPYPVYSAQMNQLIASMLQEYGTYRPTVFDLLKTVHAMRGTRSQYSYNRAPAPALTAAPPPTSSLDDILVQRKQQQVSAASAAPVGAAAARMQVLDAIAPMRRGRPEPQEDRAWEAAKAQSAQPAAASRDPWDVSVKRVEAKSPAVVSPTAGNSFGDSFKPSIMNAHVPPPINSPPAGTSTQPSLSLAPLPYQILRAPSAPLASPRPPPQAPPSTDDSLDAEDRFPSIEALDRAFSGNPSVSSPPLPQRGAGPSVPPLQGSGPHLAISASSHLRGARSQQVTGVAMRDIKLETNKALPAQPVSSGSSPVSPRPSLRRHRSSVAIKSPVIANQQRKDLEASPSPVAPALPPRPTPTQAPQHDWLTGDLDDVSPAPPPAHLARSSLNGPRTMGPRPVGAATPVKPLVGRTPSPKPPLPPRRSATPDVLEDAMNRFRPPSPLDPPSTSMGSSFSNSRTQATKPESLRTWAPPAPIRTSPKPVPTGLTDNWSPLEQRHGRTSIGPESSSEDDAPEDAGPATKSVLEPKARKSKIRPKDRNSSVHDLVDLWGGDPKGLEAPTSVNSQQRSSSGGRADVSSSFAASGLQQPAPAPGQSQLRRSPRVSPVHLPSGVSPSGSPARTRPQSMFQHGSGTSFGAPLQTTTSLSQQQQQQQQQQQEQRYTALQHQTSYSPSGNSLAAPPQDASKARAARRGSISDMVDKYEALASPRSPVAPKWSPGASATSVALPGLAAPGSQQMGRTSPGLSMPALQRKVSSGRASPAGSSISSTTAPMSAFHGRQPHRQSTLPAPLPTTVAPSSPSRTTYGALPKSTTGSSKPAGFAGLVGPATPRALPGLTSLTPKPAVANTLKPAAATATGFGASGGLSFGGSSSLPRMATGGTAKSSTPLPAVGASQFAPSTGVRTILTGTAVRTTTTGAASPALRSPTGSGHGRQVSTSVLYGSGVAYSGAPGRTMTPTSTPSTPLAAPVPLKPSSLSRRAPASGAPGLKSITPPRELNGSATASPAIPTGQPIASPTPDRPYTGVSKLIDQWQRKTEDTQTAPAARAAFKSKS